MEQRAAQLEATLTTKAYKGLPISTEYQMNYYSIETYLDM